MRSFSRRAIASVTFFSRVPALPIEPGSTPPWPASIATITSRPCASPADLTTLGGALEAERGSATERHFKIYLRDASELNAVRAALEARLLRPTDRVSWLRSDICRAALKLEIEATVSG